MTTGMCIIFHCFIRMKMYTCSHRHPLFRSSEIAKFPFSSLPWFLITKEDPSGDQLIKLFVSGLSTIFHNFARNAGTLPPGWAGKAISITGNILQVLQVNNYSTIKISFIHPTLIWKREEFCSAASESDRAIASPISIMNNLSSVMFNFH